MKILSFLTIFVCTIFYAELGFANPYPPCKEDVNACKKHLFGPSHLACCQAVDAGILDKFVGDVCGDIPIEGIRNAVESTKALIKVWGNLSKAKYPPVLECIAKYKAEFDNCLKMNKSEGIDKAKNICGSTMK